jgi:hypothetical protein
MSVPPWGAPIWRGLPDGAEPVFHVESLSDLAVPDGLNIDGHDPEALAGMRHPKQFASRRAGYLATNNDAVTGDEHFHDVELQVGNGV